MAAAETATAPSLDYLDQIPSTLPPARQRVYSREDLEVFNLLPTPCWVFDVREKSMWWSNDLGVDLWGADSLDDLLKRDFAEGMTKASIDSLMSWMQRFYQGETIPTKWTFHPNQGKDGPKRVEFKASGIFVNAKKSSTEEPTGEPWLCMLVVVEKVEGESTEEENKMFRRTEMMRNFPVIGRLFSTEGHLVDQNPQALAVFGSSRPDLAESMSSRTNRTNQSDDDAMSCASQKSNSTSATANMNDFLAQFVNLEVGRQVWKGAMEGTEYSTETMLFTSQGQSWFSVDVRETWDPVTSAKVIVFSARDISQLMQHARDQADKQNHARNEFFAVMAHELRTPLHQVVGSMELLLRSKLDEDQHENMQILQTSSRAMMAIVNDALDFTKLEAGKLSLDQLQFQVPRVIDACVAAVQLQAEKKGLNLLQFVDEKYLCGWWVILIAFDKY